MNLFLDFSFITGLLINFLILFLLFKSERRGIHKNILIIIFIYIFFTLLCFYGFLHKIRLLFYPAFIFEDTISIFVGPFLLLYIKAIYLPPQNLIKKNLIHFIIPVIYLLVITIPVLISMWNKTYLFPYIEAGEDYFSLSALYSVIYSFVALKELQKVQELVKSNYSNIYHKDLNWMKKLLIGAIVVMGVDILTTFYELFFGDLTWNIFYITALGVVLLIIYLGYHGIMQSKILLPLFLLKNYMTDKDEMPEEEIINKNKKQKDFDESEMNTLKVKLEDIIQNEKPYLNEDLSLKILANLLSITDKKLSFLLNQYMKISFYDYINQLRVEEVKQKIQDSSFANYTLLTIAFDCGFNSKTSFNRIFKKETTYSPSEYKKQVLS